MINKRPGHFELSRKMGSQRLYTKGLSRVVAAVKYVHAEFFRQGKRPMRPFAGDECVHAVPRGLLQFTARPAGHDANATAQNRPARRQGRQTAQSALQSPGQFLAFQPGLGLVTNELALLKEKRLQLLQTERGAQLRVVAQARVRVEGQV